MARRRHEGSGPALALVTCAIACTFWLLVGSVATAAVASARVDFDRMYERARDQFGSSAAERVRGWERLIADGPMLGEREKLEAVNDLFNQQIAFAEDRLVWGVEDYWATPLETLSRALGDCEDFSIAKYVTLGLMGVPIERLRLTYVRVDLGAFGNGSPQAHMVLAYYPEPGAEPLVLDHLVVGIRPASERPDLQPVFSFNSEGLWLGGVRASTTPGARLSRWRNVLRRMKEEGLL